MEDEVRIGWQIEPEIREAMRLDRARTAMLRGAWDDVVMELEEMLDESPQQPEGLFLLGEALLELGDFEGARQAYEHHVEAAGPDIDARTHAGLAVARFNTCDLPGASEAARAALRLDPGLAEAHYYLGLALERSAEDRADALAAFAAAQQLDPAAFPFPLDLTAEDWQRAVAHAMSLMPRTVQHFWSAIPILLLDLPDLGELRQADPPITPTVTGLYDGVPPDEGDPWEERPEALRLYTGNLLRCPSFEDVVEAIARTLQHEASEWLGMAPEELG